MVNFLNRLPSIRLDRPRFVMTASCPSTVAVKEHFKVKYVLLNNLQDFLAVRLVWTPDGQLCVFTCLMQILKNILNHKTDGSVCVQVVVSVRIRHCQLWSVTPLSVISATAGRGARCRSAWPFRSSNRGCTRSVQAESLTTCSLFHQRDINMSSAMSALRS